MLAHSFSPQYISSIALSGNDTRHHGGIIDQVSLFNPGLLERRERKCSQYPLQGRGQCMSDFSVAVIKHHGQGSLQKEKFILAYVFR